MSDKSKSSYNFRQSLSFQADVPDFLKKLHGQASLRPETTGILTKNSKPVPQALEDDADDDGPAYPDAEDEKPQYVLEKGITDLEVERELGQDILAALREDKPDPGETQRTGGSAGDPSRPGGRVSETKTSSLGVKSNKILEKKKKMDAKKKDLLKGVKQVKNKALLSFDDDEA